MVEPFRCSRCIKASSYIPENKLNFPKTTGFRMKIAMKLVYQYMAIFFNFSPTLYYLPPLQVENCDINLRLVVDRDDNGKVRLKWVDYSISTKIVAIKMYNVDVDNLIMP